MKDKAFLGIGWEFPPSFDNLGIKLSEREEDIKESLRILLTTTKGERVFRPEYGCNIRQWVFSKMNRSEKTLIIDTIKQAVTKGEPRVTVTNIDIEIREEEDGILWIQIEYLINATNSPDNMVFPFYFREGES